MSDTPSIAATVGFQRRISAAIASMGAFAASQAAAQTTIHVVEHAPPGGDGLTWQTAVPTIHEAIDLLSSAWPPISMIKVAQGRYFVTDPLTGTQADSLMLTSGVTLAGGFRGPGWFGSPNERNPDAFVTVISGDIGQAGVWNDNSEIGVTGFAPGAFEVDGFRFENFTHTAIARSVLGDIRITRCAFLAGFHPVNRALLIPADLRSRVFIEDCRFVSLSTRNAVISATGREVTIRRCDFIGNVLGGPAIDVPTSEDLIIEDCDFVGNDSGEGMIHARMFDQIEIRRCDISQNFNAGSFFGMPTVYVQSGDWFVMDQCQVRDNAVGYGSGGGVLIDGVADAVFSRTTLTGNLAPLDGGAIYADVVHDLFMFDCLIAGNLAGRAGGGVFTRGRAQLINCTLADNQAGVEAGAGVHSLVDPVWVESSIVWGNRWLGAPPSAGTLATQIWPQTQSQFLFSVITGVTSGFKNLAADPLLTADYRLSAGSPAINFGKNDVFASPTPRFDLDGSPRVIGRFVDAGCYEVASLPLPCGPADLATTSIRGMSGYRIPDARVNSDDFFCFLEAWGSSEAAADITTTAVPGTPGYLVPDREVSNEDFFVFLTLYQQGC